MALVPAALLVVAYRLVLFFASKQPPGAGQTGYAFGMLGLLLPTILSGSAALGIGIAGTLQRRRKRSFACIGVACSILVLATILAQVGPVDLASSILGFTEPQPNVRTVSSTGEWSRSRGAVWSLSALRISV